LGSVSPSAGVTDSSGQFRGSFVSLSNGVSTVTALVSSPLIGNLTAGTNILVTRPGGPGSSAPGSGTLSIALELLPVLVVLAVIVIIVFAARRVVKKRRRMSDESEPPIGDQP